MPVSEYWTPPEHPLSARECQWVSIEHPLNTQWVHMNANEWVLNSPWTPIECAWPTLSGCEQPMSAHDGHWVIVECDSLWCDYEKDLICVRTEHVLNACKWPWMPVKYWTPPEHLLSARECQWVRIDHLLKTPLSAHECQWVSGNSPWTPNECAWMPLSKYFKGLNAHL